MNDCEWVDRDTQQPCGGMATVRMTILSWTPPHPSRPERVATSTTKFLCPMHELEALDAGWLPTP